MYFSSWFLLSAFFGIPQGILRCIHLMDMMDSLQLMCFYAPIYVHQGHLRARTLTLPNGGKTCFLARIGKKKTTLFVAWTFCSRILGCTLPSEISWISVCDLESSVFFSCKIHPWAKTAEKRISVQTPCWWSTQRDFHWFLSLQCNCGFSYANEQEVHKYAVAQKKNPRSATCEEELFEDSYCGESSRAYAGVEKKLPVIVCRDRQTDR